ncbi:MAG TPA: 30S ribosomal protein S7 [Candidatus Paceibacterota bacterium]|nr:30S ribosomal protein S7 [Candidatus Paceibacterota bacterium]
MRRKIKARKPIQPDTVYKSVDLAKFINYIMIGGKKNTARTVVYDALKEVGEKAKTDKPIEVFESALNNVGPVTEVRSRRIGGATYQVPREVKPNRRMALAMRWIILAAEGKKGMPMASRLADEIILASKNEGEAFKKKENTHKMAEANRAFAHFAW